MSSSTSITFLGTGTSQGVPVITCDCEVCQSKNPHDKRLRSSVMFSVDGKNFVVDTGPDFRQQMLREGVVALDAVLYTHKHKDHTAGLDDVRAFNFKQKKAMELYLNEDVEQTLIKEYSYAFTENPYPGVPKLNLNRIQADADRLTIEGVKFRVIHMLHGKLPVFGFRVNDMAYCTDVSYITPSEKRKLKGLKVLVLTALRKQEHHSHFNLEQALKLIKELKPEKAYLTHISHLLGKANDVEKVLPEGVHLAYDGLKLEL